MLVYRQTIAQAQGELGSDEVADVLQALDRYADAAIWHPDPAAEFARVRYDPGASPHLAHLAASAPAAYAAWQESVRPASVHEPHTIGSLRVVDSDRGDDLFMSGEVAGSCQAVTREPTYTRSLMGFVLDGKYRMLALQAADGTTQARRMMRLMIDKASGQPVLFLEALYANAGIDSCGPEDQSLIALAREKARSMGCPLVCPYDPALAGDEYPGLAASLGCPAPFEYVDADDEGVSEGVYELDAHLLKPQEEIQREPPAWH
jgi:hypothetical protein